VTRPDWIAVDWGTSHLRAYAMTDQGEILEDAQSDKGMGALDSDQFETALLALISDWLDEHTTTPVIACGMVGAKQGWAEAPYRAVPCTPTDAGMLRAPVGCPRLNVSIISGLSQASPPDVMRGEETQIAGYLAKNPDFDGIICLPGTHSKWVQISAGEVVSFKTFMTGEIFALLSKQSVLRHSIAESGWDTDAFEAALADAISKPQQFAARLFSLRASALLDGLTPAAARARLSAALIGIELAAARPYWLGQQVVLIGADPLSQIYDAALTAQGLTPTREDAQTMTLAGLSSAYLSTTEAS